MLQIMGADSADELYRSNLKLHQPGTCLWFLDGRTFVDWYTTPNAKLWVYGIPGAGKTILSALAIQKALAVASETRAVIFYYCSFKDDRTRHLSGILTCFIGQLARQNEECLAILQRKFQGFGDLNTSPWTKNHSDLVALLGKMCAVFEEVNILIDGVDECHDASTVSETLADLSKSSAVRILVSSRREHHIKIFLEDFTAISIAAESQDLRLYVPAEIELRMRKQKLRISNPDLKDEIIEKLVDGAKGMLVYPLF